MSILLFPTNRDLETEVVKGPVVIIEQFVRSDGTMEFYTSIYANHVALDRKTHATLADAITVACERDRHGVRLKRPASFNPADPTRTELDMGRVPPPPATDDHVPSRTADQIDHDGDGG